MPRPMAPSGFVKPTLDTRFHIDYEWWERSSHDLALYMVGHLCAEHKEQFATNPPEEAQIDWIDPQTGQVLRVDPLRYTLLTHCCHQPDFISGRTSLVDSVFRALLAAGNRPMTPVELAERTGRPAETILRTLSGEEVYRGLRPFIEDT